jgi:hypothetical protein
MAKQKGFLNLQGTFGDVTFLKTKDGYIAKRKSEVSSDRIKKDKSYQRTRENNAEFTNAAKAGKLLRHAIKKLLNEAKDSKVTSRLMKVMLAVAKTDTVSDRGLRTVANGDFTLLEKFEFNADASLSNTLSLEVGAVIDRTAGTFVAHIPGYVPKTTVAAPEGTTHFKIVTAAVEADFAAGNCVSHDTETDVLPWDATPIAATSMSNSFTVASVKPVFLVLGVQFIQRANGKDYPLQSGAFNALSIIKTSIA